MSKSVLYGLVLGITYATLDKGIFRVGVGYTAEQLGEHVEDKNDDGEKYFEEVDAEEIVGDDVVRGEVKISKKSITIRKKAVVSAAGPEDDEGGDKTIGNVDPDKVTV